MKENNHKKFKWRKLDSSAKLFPIIAGKKLSSVFRLSVILKEKVEPYILKVALDKTLAQYDSFKVGLRKGFFWYYLEYNTKDVIISKEDDYPCKYIDRSQNNNYLFKVTYFENKINIDIFHSLTDGNGAMDFLKELTYNYLGLVHKEELEKENLYRNIETYNNTEDSYIKNYSKSDVKREKTKRAYILRGNSLPLYALGVTHYFINLESLKKVAKEKKCTITQYLTALVILSIFKENYIKSKSRKPIKVFIPVNLKNYFDSETVSNFFSYINIEANLNINKDINLDYIISIVKQEFDKKLNKQSILKTMSSNTEWGNNIAVSAIPLALKKAALKMSFTQISKYSTTTLSNLGIIKVKEEYEKYIDNFLFLLSTAKIERIKCSVLSYKESIIFTFTSSLNNCSIQQTFLETLKKSGINAKIEGNGVYDIIS